MLVNYADIELGQLDHSRGGVRISEIDFSYPEIRSSDNPREARDGVTPGRDYFGGRTMSIECFTDGDSMTSAREMAGNVLSRWRDAAVRLQAGVLAPLDFQAVDDATVRRVYGRPRRADDPGFDVVMRQGKAAFSLEFDVMDPTFYAGGDEGLESATIRVVAGGSGTGWVFPITWPVRTEAVAERREGSLTVTGELPTAAQISFHGPGRRLSLDGNRGWHVGLNSSVELAYDEVLTIDPLAGTVTDNFGRDRYGALDRRSQLTGIMLTPGVENVFFSAEDQSNTAHATVSWRPAFPSAA